MLSAERERERERWMDGEKGAANKIMLKVVATTE